ncbi:glycoside hydrolase family 2 TIM barrel-domain containing protein [Flavihumibacter solisilvae]|uniref:Glycoside hydrolase n=1 Tax=Flavihumibacter solisilvae TaxID=1349421 RepID=A0A0C1IV02_9BACT|nr:glycoside hydrolase family 2 TIM barrel-domain containing protein [Flavihumibacter solisilvae]KIC94339.1 hypothetical protein OI18_12000 [Flavihumibacter solisilvae]
MRLKGFGVLAIFAGAFQFTTACKEAELSINRTTSFDDGWKFTRDSITGAESPSFNDANWRELDLPHDWSIEDIPEQRDSITVGPFSKESPGKAATGHVLGGTGWYRKSFAIDAADSAKVISIYFEGAYMETDTWVNGHHVGNHPHGYTSFQYDITRFLNAPGKPNTIAVRVKNPGRNSRWYSGSGIYRHVWLTATDLVHIPQWGIQVTSHEITSQSATVKVNAVVVNKSAGRQVVEVRTRLVGPQGEQAGESKQEIDLAAGDSTSTMLQLKVSSPQLWTTEVPAMYKAEVDLLVNGSVKDRLVTPFGIRTVDISASNGFRLNGKTMKLQGGCIHHDNGLLGSAAIDRAEERKVELLKANGFNALRCSHNPPSEKLLEACDRLGMLVIDEPFDHWQKAKNPDDYHRFFDDWWERDFSSMILRDRNHPSIIMWSIGNEIEERADSSGVEITKRLKAKAQELDPTRKITEAVNEFWDHPGRPWSMTAPAFELLDVGGYNYQWWEYENDHAKFPDRVIMGTESVPKHALENWNLVEKHPYVIGDFVWTAMDYLGESGIGHTTYETGKIPQLRPWPWFNANCGDIDLIGGKKPQSYYRDVVWRRSKIEIAVHAPYPKGAVEQVSYWGWPDEEQSWTWPGSEGKPLEVKVYSRSPRVRLMLNGKTVGEKQTDSLLTANFEVPYEPGELKAVALESDSAGSVVLTSAGAPAALKILADRTNIKANRNDLSYVTVEVVDAKGNIVPHARLPIKWTLTGNGEIAGVGNADPADMGSFKSVIRNTFRGKMLVILRPKKGGGEMMLKVETPGLATAEVKVVAKD